VGHPILSPIIIANLLQRLTSPDEMASDDEDSFLPDDGEDGSGDGIDGAAW
jgi:hypothetical protein